MERKVGEIFEYNGEWYQTVEAPIDEHSCNGCQGCKGTGGPRIFGGECNGNARKDNKFVIFKKLEKVGEPYDDCGTILQRFRIHTNVTNADTKGLELHIYSNNTIGIEIKQNKEDMEEKTNKASKKIELNDLVNEYINELIDYDEFEKGIIEWNVKYSNSESTGKNLNLFSLEAAKAGKPVCTRDGRKARIICFDLQSIEKTPIVAAVHVTDKQEVISHYYEDGRQFVDGISELDLMMLPEKKEGWVNVYQERCYESKEQAIKHIAPGTHYIDTIRLEWEE